MDPKRKSEVGNRIIKLIVDNLTTLGWSERERREVIYRLSKEFELNFEIPERSERIRSLLDHVAKVEFEMYSDDTKSLVKEAVTDSIDWMKVLCTDAEIEEEYEGVD